MNNMDRWLRAVFKPLARTFVVIEAIDSIAMMDFFANMVVLMVHIMGVKKPRKSGQLAGGEE